MERGNRVVLAVDRVRDGHQVPLFCKEEEYQPHHERKGGLVNVLLRDPFEQGAPAFPVGAVKRGDEHFDSAAYLAAESGGDFLLILQAATV